MAKTVFGQLLEDLVKGVGQTGSVVLKTAASTAENEGRAQALQLIFDGKPQWATDRYGRIEYFWVGDELKKAQARIKALASSKGGNVAVDFIPVVMPTLFEKTAPILLLLGGWIYFSRKEKRR